MSLFRDNIQQQTQSTGGGLFSGGSNSIFGTSNNKSNTNNKGLFGNLLTNTGSQNTNNQQTNDKQTPSLFSNTSIGNNGLFGFNNNNNQTGTNNNNTNDKGLFSGLNSNNTNNIFGNFQNNKTSNDNNNKSIIPSSVSLFGTQTNNTQSVQNSQANNEQKNKKDETFSIFGNNLANIQEKPKENNNTTITNDQNKPNLFSNISKDQPSLGFKPPEGKSIFGIPKEEKKSENNTNAINTQSQAQGEVQKKEKEEANKSNAPLFGNNINNQSGIPTVSLFGNTDNKKDQSQNKNTISIPNSNPSQQANIFNKNNNNNANINQNAQNQNNINNNNNQQANQQANIKSNDNKNYLNIKIPEKPFEISFGNSKELEEYEKNQIMHKTNKEIIDDFKNMLLTQKAKYKQCVSNTREFERKLMGIIDITNTNSLMSEINEKNGKKYLSKINSIYYQSKNLENILTNFNDKLNQTLSPYRDNVMNSDKIFLNQNNSERFKFYENFAQLSEKCYLIENSINEAEQNLAKKEKEINEKEDNKKEGVWIERNRGKIFVNQNEINNLFSECYDGLSNLKSMQDNIDKRYEMLKMKLLEKTGNNYINNINFKNNFKYNNNIY